MLCFVSFKQYKGCLSSDFYTFYCGCGCKIGLEVSDLCVLYSTPNKATPRERVQMGFACKAWSVKLCWSARCFRAVACDSVPKMVQL